MSLLQGSEADGRDGTYPAGASADRGLARQGEGLLHLGRGRYTPARMRSCGRAAGRRRAVGYLSAGPLWRLASPNRLRGSGPMRPATRGRAHALSEPLPAAVCSARHRRT